jgi:CRISPR/Cas system-associated endonuclease Cas1
MKHDGGVTALEKGTDKTVPLADVAVIVCAARDTEFSASSLRRMAELNVLLLVCNEKFEPCAITLPYYRPTNTELLRRQIEWTSEWKTAMWRQIVTAKVRNQAANLAHLKRAHSVLMSIAERCAKGAAAVPAAPNDAPLSESSAPGVDTEDAPRSQKVSISGITASKRAAYLLDSPNACESRAARHYWKHLLPRMSKSHETDEKRRVPGTREGVNGMLDYGYAILRTAVLRSLAAHGFIAAIGIRYSLVSPFLGVTVMSPTCPALYKPRIILFQRSTGMAPLSSSWTEPPRPEAIPITMPALANFVSCSIIADGGGVFLSCERHSTPS